MTSQTINIIIKYIIIIGLAIISFLPLYVANDLFFPFISGKGFAFRIIVEIVFALWFILILREKGTTVINTDKSVAPRINAITISITSFTLIILAADLLGLNPLRSIWSNFERMEGWMTIVHLWAYFMVLSSVLNTRENWKKFLDVVLLSGFIVAIYGLFQFFGWTATHQGSRVDASLGNSAYMAVYMLINAFISAYLATEYFSKKNHLFWIYTVFAALFSFIMFQTATRGTILGWIAGILISCAIYSIFGRKNKGQTNFGRLMSTAVIAVVIIIGITFWYYREAEWIKSNQVLGRLATISLSDTRTQARGFIWPMAIKGVFENPKSAIIGIGQENFNYIFNSHYDPEMWKHEQWFDRAHSVFLDWLVAGGLLGLLAYLSLYIISLLYIYKSEITIGQKSILIGLLTSYGIHNVFVFDNQTSYIMFFTFLAFVHCLVNRKLPSFFKKFDKKPSEDAITVRDYIYVPVIIILLFTGLYFINIRTIQANAGLISSLRSCSDTKNTSIKTFEKILALDQMMANQEIREQLLSCTANVIKDQQSSQKNKVDFYNLTKNEIQKQIDSAPNDARIYIIAGSFYNSIGDYMNATPLLEKANILSPNKQSIMNELALNYFNVGRNSEALAIMEKAYFSSTDNVLAKQNYASALITVGEDTKARELFLNDKELFYDQKIISAYVYKKQYGKAIEIYKELINISPDNQDLYSSLASVYIQNGQNDLAINILKKAGEKFPLLKTRVDEIIKQIQEGKVKPQ